MPPYILKKMICRAGFPPDSQIIAVCGAIVYREKG